MGETTRLAAYLERIGYDGPVAPDLETLRGMHRAHFQRIPFENLNIQRGEPIVVEPSLNYEKIVARRRGGFCLELSGLFAWSLREIGMRVDILGGRVLAPDGTISPPLSRMVLLVHLDEPWIADVGFGGRIAGPLRLNDPKPQAYGRRTYAVANDGDHWLVTCSEPWQDPPSSTYLFTLEPREYADFNTVCHWLQTSPDSRFTQGDLASLGTEEGRLTYAGGRLILTGDGGREEIPVAAEDLSRVLHERFAIEV